MKFKKIALFAFVISSVLVGTHTSHALSVGGYGDVSVEATPVSGTTSVMTNTNTRVGGAVNVKADTQVKINSSTYSGTNGGTMTTQTSEVSVINLQKADASVSTVNTADDDEVSVTYNRTAKLFGFITVNLTETATVTHTSDAKIKAKVSKSWWSFFATSEAKTDEFSSNLNARIEKMKDLQIQADAHLSAEQKALLVSQITASAEATYALNN